MHGYEDRSRRRGSGRGARPAAAVTAIVLALGGAGGVHAQMVGPGDNGAQFQEGVLPGAHDGVVFRSASLDREVETLVPLLEHDGPYVVVNLAENRVFVFEGNRAVWSARAGTGTGFRLERGEHEWKFSTPRGLMRIQRKEKDPIWEAPDWYYVENGLPIPATDDPRRSMRGMMGNTALYLGDGVAIHGTNRPELLLHEDPDRRRVSHGCIRLTNEDARTLYHMVDVGTPVLIY